VSLPRDRLGLFRSLAVQMTIPARRSATLIVNFRFSWQA
jgi:hypothetical protein